LGITADTRNLQLSPPECTQEQLNRNQDRILGRKKKWLAKGNEEIGVLKLNTGIRQTCGIEEKNCS